MIYIIVIYVIKIVVIAPNILGRNVDTLVFWTVR